MQSRRAMSRMVQCVTNLIRVQRFENTRNRLILQPFPGSSCTFNQLSRHGRKMPGSPNTLRPCRTQPVAKTDPHSPLAAFCHLTSGPSPVTEF